MSTSHHDKTIDSQEVICGGCRAANPVQRRFCGRCGQRLWEPCSECDLPNATDLQFCGSCGVALQEAFQQRVADIKARLNQFEELRSEGRYFEALTTLQGVRDSKDTRFAELLAKVKEKLAEVSGERDARAQSAEQQLEEGRGALASQDYNRALVILRQIPRGLRTKEMSDALQASENYVNEIQTLTRTIKTGIRDQSLDHLLPTVNRLLELRSHDAQLLRLRDQLEQRQRQRISTTAAQQLLQGKKLFASGQYRAAARQIEGIEEDRLTDEQRRLYDVIREVDFVIAALRREPFVHQRLMELAMRWQKFRPQDEDAKRVTTQLVKRIATSERLPTPVRWAKQPDLSHAGCPVVWWRGLKTEMPLPSDDSNQQAPSRFTVAYGLALQGVGAAALPLNILPRRNTAFLDKLTSLRKNSTPKIAWGCDLGASGLKAMLVERDKSGEVQIVDMTFVPHDQPLVELHDSDGIAQQLHRTMSTFVEEHVEGNPPAVLGFSAPRSLGRSFEIPRFKGKKIEEAIAYEAKLQIPIPADEICFDWHTWPVADDGARFQSVTLLAARKDQIRQQLAAVERLPLQIVAVQSVCFALYNAAIADLFPDGDTSDDEDKKTKSSSPAETIGVLDVGVDSSTLVVASSHLVRHRSLPVGTGRLDAELMKRFKLTRAQSEKVRHEPGSARWIYAIQAVVEEIYGVLARDLNRTIRSYETEGLHISRMVVTGGGSEQLGLLRSLVHGGSSDAASGAIEG